MDYKVIANHVNLFKENIIMINIDKLMLIKFIMKMMLKHVINVKTLNQLQILAKIKQIQMDYNISVNHVNLL